MSTPASANAAACSASALGRLRGVVAQVHRPLDRRRVAADLRAALVEHRADRGPVGRRPTVEFQCCAKRATVRSVRVGPLPPIAIGGCGRCTGFGSQRAFAQLHVLAVEVAVLLREQQDERLDALVEAVEALLQRRERDAVRVALLLVPPGADAELEPTVGDRCRSVAAMFASTAGWR